MIIIACGLVVQKWLIRFFITGRESYSNISFSSSSVFFFFLLLLEVRQFEAEQLTWLNFSLIEVRQESSSFCHLTHRNTKMFAPSPSSSVCSTVLSVQVITFEYRYSRQDHGAFGCRISRLWTCKNNTSFTGLSSLRLLWLHFQSFLRKLTPCKVDLCFKKQLSEHAPPLLSYDSPGYKRVCGKKKLPILMCRS